jgi:hypothetical protein
VGKLGHQDVTAVGALLEVLTPQRPHDNMQRTETGLYLNGGVGELAKHWTSSQPLAM